MPKNRVSMVIRALPIGCACNYSDDSALVIIARLMAKFEFKSINLNLIVSPAYNQ